MSALAALIFLLFPMVAPGVHTLRVDLSGATVVSVIAYERDLGQPTPQCSATPSRIVCAVTGEARPQISIEYAPAPDRCHALPITLRPSIDGVAQPAQELGSIAPSSFCAYLPGVMR